MSDIHDVRNRLIGDAKLKGGTTIRVVSTFRLGEWLIHNVTTGFAVGGASESLVIPPHDSWDHHSQVHWLERKVRDGVVLGSWQNDRGRVWLDVVTIVRDREEALILARGRGEQSIYDLDTGEEIPIERGTNGQAAHGQIPRIPW